MRINFSRERHIKGMKKIRANPLGKSREERESCFPEGMREEIRPHGEQK